MNATAHEPQAAPDPAPSEAGHTPGAVLWTLLAIPLLPGALLIYGVAVLAERLMTRDVNPQVPKNRDRTLTSVTPHG